GRSPPSAVTPARGGAGAGRGTSVAPAEACRSRGVIEYPQSGSLEPSSGGRQTDTPSGGRVTDDSVSPSFFAAGSRHRLRDRKQRDRPHYPLLRRERRQQISPSSFSLILFIREGTRFRARTLTPEGPKGNGAARGPCAVRAAPLL